MKVFGCLRGGGGRVTGGSWSPLSRPGSQGMRGSGRRTVDRWAGVLSWGGDFGEVAVGCRTRRGWCRILWETLQRADEQVPRPGRAARCPGLGRLCPVMPLAVRWAALGALTEHSGEGHGGGLCLEESVAWRRPGVLCEAAVGSGRWAQGRHIALAAGHTAWGTDRTGCVSRVGGPGALSP